ncbi:MAG: hypothetical protein P8013_02925 [Candidatus Sulfobium sp.]
MEIKYLMIDRAWPVLLMGSIEHRALRPERPERISSAGFVRFVGTDEGLKAETYGHSEGLDLSPDPEDAELITLFFCKAFPKSNGGEG